MDRQNIANNIIEMAEIHYAGSPTLDSRLMDDLNMDSIDYVDFILMIESEFYVEINDDEMFKMATIGDVVGKVINLKLKQEGI